MGELTYSMIVTPGLLGGKTNIKIVDDHGVDKIYPRSVSSQPPYSRGDSMIFKIS